MALSDYFKPYIVSSGGYQGGKSAPLNMSVHKLSSNENLLGCSPKVVEQIAVSFEPHIYPDPQGTVLRKALSTSYQEQLTKDQMIIANGGSEVLDMIIRSFIKPGDECIVSSPYFTPYAMFSAWAGAHIIDVPLMGDLYELDVVGILNHITDKTRIIFLTSPNNPTGTIIKRDDFEHLLSALPDHVIIVYDEVYKQFADNTDYFDAVEYVNKGCPIIAVNSFSKAYGLASLRIGYGYSTAELASYINKIYRPFQVNELSLRAATTALSDQQWLDKTSTYIINERNWLTAQLIKQGIKTIPSQANFVYIKSPYEEATFVADLAAAGIMIRPCAAFGGAGFARVTVGHRLDNEAFLSSLDLTVRSKNMTSQKAACQA